MRWLVVVALAACGSPPHVDGDAAAPGDGRVAGDGGGSGGALDGLPDTSDGIHLFADQLDNGLPDSVVAFAASHYAGTQKMLYDENARFVADNPNWFLLHYRLGSSSGPVPYIHANAWSSDFADVTTHEDWFMHNEQATRHHDPASNWDINDISNPGFRDYWTSSVIADMRATGAHGVFADSFEAGISGYGVTDPDARFDGTNPANPTYWPDGTWLVQKQRWIADVEATFAATPEHFAFVPNIGAMITGWADIDYSAIDGAMLEGFGQHLAEADWVLGANRSLRLTGAGKFIIVQSYPGDAAERDFLLATYLLVKGSHSFVNLAGSGVVYFPEYALPIGTPVAALPSDIAADLWMGLYRRDFTNGMVLVNPSTSAVTVTLPRTLQRATPSGGGTVGAQDLDGNGNYIAGSIAYAPVSSVTIAAGGAALLVDQP